MFALVVCLRSGRFRRATICGRFDIAGLGRRGRDVTVESNPANTTTFLNDETSVAFPLIGLRRVSLRLRVRRLECDCALGDDRVSK